MPVCLKCGWEIIIGPGGCACTQARRQQHNMEEAARAGERLAKEFAPLLEEARRVAALPPEEQERLKVQEAMRKIDGGLREAYLAMDTVLAEWHALQKSCKHPSRKLLYGTQTLVCDDCGYQK